ncbi:MAG: DUF748 domain-containing protein, partial [Nitrospira sp.]|nr:DUF748 domain-containing protein [Nitrospira sp.]
IVKVPMISNFPNFLETHVTPLFMADIDGTPVKVDGRTLPFSDSLETVMDLDISGLDIAHYLAYVPAKLNFKLLSGSIDAQTTLSFLQYKDRPSSIILSGQVGIKKVHALDMAGESLIVLPSLDIVVAPSDLSAGKLKIASINLDSPEIYLVRGNDGNINIQEMVLGNGDDETAAAEKGEADAFVLEIDEAAVRAGNVFFADDSMDESVKLAMNNLNFMIKGFSTVKGTKSKVSLDLSINSKGKIAAEGSLGIEPLSAVLNLDFNDIDLIQFQPYVAEQIKILITGGRFSMNGELKLAAAEDSDLNAAYSGDAALAGFASVDKLNADDFLKWEYLDIKGVKLNTSPFDLHIQEVALSDFYSRLIINEDGSLNVQGIVKSKEPEEAVVLPEVDEVMEQGSESADMGSVKIDTVTLQAGTINFSDRHIKPDYSASLLEIGGRLSGLSSSASTMADVELAGKLESYASLTISGTINPLRDDLYVNLKTDFRDMDLSPLTPYAGKYAGYTIKKGSLSLELEYLIADKQIDSRNRIRLDQFTFGEKVESMEATRLPVKFAVSLMKDSSGQINLDIPVKGSMEDPEFSIGGVVLKIIVNMLVKAATSPFALLGAIVGGGDELGYVIFEDGSLELSAHETQKLDRLSKALNDRPSLKMDIEGRVDPEGDMVALKELAFMKKLKDAKLRETVKHQGKTASVEDIMVSDEEYEKYLILAYENEKFPKPKDTAGKVKVLPSAEMQKLIFAHILISDDDLRHLAEQRARTVKDYLLKDNAVEPGRVMLLDLHQIDLEKEGAERNRRVVFTLK